MRKFIHCENFNEYGFQATKFIDNRAGNRSITYAELDNRACTELVVKAQLFTRPSQITPMYLAMHLCKIYITAGNQPCKCAGGEWINDVWVAWAWHNKSFFPCWYHWFIYLCSIVLQPQLYNIVGVIFFLLIIVLHTSVPNWILWLWGFGCKLLRCKGLIRLLVQAVGQCTWILSV